MIKLCTTILLIVFTTVTCQHEHLFSCVQDSQGTMGVLYNGTLHHATYYFNSTNLADNQTEQNMTVCIYNNHTAMSLNTSFDISCTTHSNGNVSTLSVIEGSPLEVDICFSELEHGPGIGSTQGLFAVPDSPTMATFDPGRPMATLAVIDSDGYIANSVTSNEELRLRVQTLTNEEYFPPIIGQCWYRLSSGDQNNRTIVQPSVMFVEYGCSVQDENQLIMTNQDLFYINGLMEKVSYPFDLSKFYESPIDFIRITCEVYYCTKAQHCRARCPPSQTTYQVSGHPKRLNLTTEIFVVFARPTTKQPTTRSGIVLGSPGTTESSSADKSILEKYQPYFLIGTLILTALSLCVIIGFVAKFIRRNREDGEIDDNAPEQDVVFHKNIHTEEHGVVTTKDNHHLLDQNHNINARKELGLHGNHKMQESGFHGNHKVPEYGNQDVRHANRHHGDKRFIENLHPDVRTGNSYHGNLIFHPSGYTQNDYLEQQNQRERSGRYNNEMPHGTQGNVSQNDLLARHPNGFHGSWIPRPHTDVQSHDKHGVHGSMTQVKSNMGGNFGVASPPPAYISKTNLRSTPRSQGMVNYGFEGDRTTLQSPHHGNMAYTHGNLSYQHGNSRMEARGTPDLPALHADPQSPVGGKLYPWQDLSQGHYVEKPEERKLRQHRSDTALLNDALREYFHKHGMLK